jgi:hypothetical protein
VCDFNFGGAATGQEGLLFDKRADGAVGVMEGPFCLLQDERVCATANDGDGLCGCLNASYFDVAGAGSLNFFDEVSLAELVLCEGVNVCDGFAAGALLKVRL